MKISIISAFPNAFSFLQESINKRAQEKGAVELNVVNLMNFGSGKWSKIDDRPFGGGAGMVIGVEPIYEAIKSLQLEPMREDRNVEDTKIVMTSARGETWTQNSAENYTALAHLVIICGHYEGIDHRVVEHFVDSEISIGNYILSGGEPAAMVITDSIVRLLPGVLGNDESIKDETQFFQDHKLTEYPVYTRPEIFMAGDQKLIVPEILLSGNHGEVEKWKEENRKKI
jgi:tRNA (guanine37-N1)-methyltransferase